MNPSTLFPRFPESITDTGIHFLKTAQHPDRHQAKYPGWLSPVENPTVSAAVERFESLALAVNPNEKPNSGSEL